MLRVNCLNVTVVIVCYEIWSLKNEMVLAIRTGVCRQGCSNEYRCQLRVYCTWIFDLQEFLMLCCTTSCTSNKSHRFVFCVGPRKDMPYDLQKFSTCAAALLADQMNYVVDIHYRFTADRCLGRDVWQTLVLQEAHIEKIVHMSLEFDTHQYIQLFNRLYINY